MRQNPPKFQSMCGSRISAALGLRDTNFANAIPGAVCPDNLARDIAVRLRGLPAIGYASQGYY